MTIGIDEVGRGCLAGPLVIGAVSLDKTIIGLKDSKLLSKKQRLTLARQIYSLASACSLGWVWPHEIDNLGLTRATTLAIKRALCLIDQQMDEIILDGKYNYLDTGMPVKLIVSADQLIPTVSAASVIAKVARDYYMEQMSAYFPVYDFMKHVGYGTANHLSAIASYGPCVLHRLSFRPLSEVVPNGF